MRTKEAASLLVVSLIGMQLRVTATVGDRFHFYRKVTQRRIDTTRSGAKVQVLDNLYGTAESRALPNLID